MNTDEIVIVDYDPKWKSSFEAESARVLSTLGGDLVIKIEHVGSTSIPGLAAKPIIDMLVFVHSLTRAKDKISALEALGYAYWEDNPDKTRLFFVRGLPPNGPRTHHIHIAEATKGIDPKVLFRDYLRAHPEDAQRYLHLKQRLAADHSHDREKYTEEKTSYIHSVLEKARKDQACDQ